MLSEARESRTAWRMLTLASIAEAQADKDDIAGALRTCRTMHNVLRPLEPRVRAAASVPMRSAIADIAVKQASWGTSTGCPSRAPVG